MSARAKRLRLVLGCLLLLGGAAHSVGVLHLYALKGWPDANRILLDAWIAEAQIVAGALFAASARAADPYPWTFAGTLVVWGFALPFLPVLLHRAPPVFWIAPVLYSLAGAALLRGAHKSAASAEPVR